MVSITPPHKRGLFVRTVHFSQKQTLTPGANLV